MRYLLFTAIMYVFIPGPMAWYWIFVNVSILLGLNVSHQIKQVYPFAGPVWYDIFIGIALFLVPVCLLYTSDAADE